MNIPQTLQLAFDQHRTGQVAAAELLYRQILAEQPEHADALHLLGLAAHEQGRTEEAVGLIRRAIAANPTEGDYYANLARIFQGQGKAKEAEESLRNAAVLRAVEARKQNRLGHSRAMEEKMAEAIGHFARAVALEPNSAEFHYDLGRAYAAVKQMDPAIASLRKAIALKRDHRLAYVELADALSARDQTHDAIDAYRRAMGLGSNDPRVHNNLGVALCRTLEFSEAAVALQHAIALRPDMAESFNNLGHALLRLDRTEEAIAAYQKALSLRPDYAEAHSGLGSIYLELGRDAEAIAEVRRAIEIKPDYGEAHLNLCLLLLQSGDWENGWKEYEWRWRVPSLRMKKADTPRPEWDGKALGGKRILIWREAGFGDAIQAVRFSRDVAELGGKITLAERPQLTKLFGRMGIADRIVTYGDQFGEHDVQCSILSLPGLLGIRPDSIPKRGPYLKADPQRAAEFKARMPTDGRLKVGLVWANKPDPLDRCPPAAAWSVLAEIGGAWFCSLQKPIHIAPMFGGRTLPPLEMPAKPPGLEMADWTEELRDFDDTAALIEHLDLIICVDTAVAHLAGAMGKPVWVVLRQVADWRWLQNRTDSPWYPTMRLLRQERRREWEKPVREVAGAMKEMIRARPA
ncbi:MAG TPA: tetratricopeptide repeat protein [Tepidisphaeraceae bacterium]|nr:tetratricopeptide repeat protein [Tepidisphaeraceae bacterium]